MVTVEWKMMGVVWRIATCWFTRVVLSNGLPNAVPVHASHAQPLLDGRRSRGGRSMRCVRNSRYDAPSNWICRIAYIAALIGCGVVMSGDARAESVVAPVNEQSVVVESMPRAGELAEEKMLIGEVSGVGGRFLSVEYERSTDGTSAQDMGFQLAEETVLVGVDQLMALGLGDRVSVSYQEFTRYDEQGDVAGIRRVPTRVSLISKAVPVVQQEPVDGAATATP